MGKCNGKCGVCAACKFRATKGVTVVPASASEAMSEAEFEQRASEASRRENEAERAMEQARERAWLRVQGIRDDSDEGR